jgi:hypothetical protein
LLPSNVCIHPKDVIKGLAKSMPIVRNVGISSLINPECLHAFCFHRVCLRSIQHFLCNMAVNQTMLYDVIIIIIDITIIIIIIPRKKLLCWKSIGSLKEENLVVETVFVY